MKPQNQKIKEILIETNEYSFPIFMAIDNGKILHCSLELKYIEQFAKDYEFIFGYQIQVISTDCYI